jgi:integrase
MTAQDRAIYALAAFAGLRMGEVRALQWSDVDFALSTIHVRRSFSLGRIEAPKSGRVRSVPLIEQVSRELLRLPRGDSSEGLIFTGQNGGPIDDSRVRRRFYEAYARAGLKPLRFHDLRHSFGTMAVQAFPLSDVAAFMGHAAIETTMIYVHHVPKQDAASKLARIVGRGRPEDAISNVDEVPTLGRVGERIALAETAHTS